MSAAWAARPVGAFVHHQGRGHAERPAAPAHALASTHPKTVFYARPAILPPLPEGTVVLEIPSLFEAPVGNPQALDNLQAPDSLHCAPVGWSTIRRAVAVLTDWFDRVDPVIFLTDVSAEMAQLARISSVPTVCVLQHGDRADAGHLAARLRDVSARPCAALLPLERLQA